MDFKGAIFDMDGTLINSLVVWESIFSTIFKKFNSGEVINFTPQEIKTFCTSTFDKTSEYLHTKYSLGNSTQEILDTFNSSVYDFYSSEVKVKDGVIEFLEYCLENNVKMCLASATDISLMHVAVKHCGLKKYFSHIISCSEIGKGKEFPDIYLKGLELLGTEKAETYIFEDSLISVKTAKSAGFTVVAVYEPLNTGHDEIKKTADIYIAEGETLMKIVK